MANAEMQLVSRIVRSGDIATPINWGISDNDFRTNEGKSIWRYCFGYYAAPESAGSVIGPNIFQNLWPQIQLMDDPSMTMEALCMEVRRRRIIAEAKEATLALVDNVELDPTNAISILHSQMQNLLALGESRNHDLSFGSALQKLQARYDVVKKNQYAYARMKYPWEIMNDRTGGIQEDDFIILYGRPKSMKTWMLSMIITAAFQQEKKLLVYTKEMTPENLNQRIAACVANFPYQELRNGKMSLEDEIMLNELVKYTNDKYSQANIITLDGRSVPAGGDTVAWLQSKVEHYKPDVLFVDGMYLLSDSASGKRTADWQRVTNISRALRDMILHTHTPVVATMQANRGAEKHSDGNLGEIAYADAVGQDATVAIRTINNKRTEEINLIFAGSREFKLHGIKIHGKPAVDFSFIQELTEIDVEMAEKQDAMDEEERAKSRKKKPRTRTDKVDQDNDKEIDRALGTIHP